MAKKRPPLGPVNREYQPTAQERIKLQAQEARKHAATAPRLKVGTRAGLPNIEPDHSDFKVASALLMEAIGTCDPNFTHGLIKYMVAAVEEEEGRVDETAINFLLVVVKDIKPTDQLEAMLAAQMAVLHMATMMHSKMFYRPQTLERQNLAVNGLNKCARSFAMLMEALKRYRTGGQQTVTVQHVSVSEGGQAIVGNVTQTASDTASKSSQRRGPALTDARQTPMPIIAKPRRVRVTTRRGRKDEEE